MAAEKLSKKELKAPDRFQVVGGKAQGWLHSHQSTVAIGVGVLFLGLVGVGIAQWVSKTQADKAAKEFGEALRPLSRPVDSTSTATGEDAAFKSQQEKDEETEKSLSAFVASHGGKPAATSAKLPLAQAQLRLGKYDPAVSNFEGFLAKAPTGDPLRSAGLEGLGYAYEGKGDLDKALATFERLASETNTEFLIGMGAYHASRVLLAQGKKDQAAKELAQIPSKFPNTAAARMAQERLAALVAQGVVPSVPSPGAVGDAG